MKKKNLFLIIGIILFLGLMILVKIKDNFYIDLMVSKFITGFKSKQLTIFFRWITKLGSFKMGLIVCFIILLFSYQSYFGFIYIIIIKIINYIIKTLINRARPNLEKALLLKESSFPSSHATIAVTVYGLLIYIIYKRVSNNFLKLVLIIILSLIILLIGVSRIYLDVHYFTDILGGYLLGIIYLIVITNYLILKDNKVKIRTK